MNDKEVQSEPDRKDKEVQSEEPEEGIDELQKSFSHLVTSVQMRFKELEEKERWWKGIEEKMMHHANAATKKVTLDVGMI
jgi:hypothetical protein